MSWVLRILGFPVATLTEEVEEWIEEEPEGISGGATHNFERADNDQTCEIQGEPWDEWEYDDRSDFGFRRP
ncbi:hypothetical protein SEA_CONQUERAGE_29 [Mycobacterium phage Conquerage]|uniref:Uncharacterized protein n=4 Tax=Fromanvirus alma TaxID=1089111 RepID=A0A142K4T7_9CAUD|nr:minor tail protein [Mycobacterium phage Alma]AER48740.1 hypothetical protein ALMA_29 [Mycobacterium phage Alma]AMS00829.1 hypothetical protein PBI_EIDSMOE_29 [Mycobacterium phage Eidsmoe]AVI03738.1 hypothetical protein SEA_CONQUERAGE_29 [Mycobacterium phage Conquerage]AXC35040.1 hypothetical protein SEA_PRIYA_29 [Mycobacterium phage Priya]